MLADSAAEAGNGGAGQVRLGPFVVEPDGSLRPMEGHAPAFTLRWRGRTLHARIAARQGGDALGMEVVLGCVPSSAACGGDPVPRRDRALALARALPDHVPAGWRLRLLPSHHIGLRATQRLPAPALAADLLAGLTGFLLRLDPYLAVLDAAGSGLGPAPAPASAGSANT